MNSKNLQDSLMRDRIVCGIKSDDLRKRLLRVENLTLQRAIDICRANEASESQIKNIVDEKAVNDVVAQGAHGRRQRDRGNSRHTHNSTSTHDGDKSRKRQGKYKYCGSRMLEETVQRMERNAENAEEITIFKKCTEGTVCICSKRSPT